MTEKITKHAGSCHCGVVRYEADLDLSEGSSQCNCSICTKVNQLGRVLKPDAFKLLAGEDSLTAYEWGGKVSRRYFCKHCGVHCFARGHLPELGGDFVSICFNTLDGVEFRDLKVVHWNGRHNDWEAGPRDRPWPILATPPAAPSSA